MDYGYNNQYSTTSYGAQGAADGGGFVGGEIQSSPAAGKGGYGKDTVRPLTVKQILEAHQPHPDAEFKVDGDSISQITFVGQIRGISTQTTNITYQVDDGTGIVDVKLWVDIDANQDQMDTDSNKNKLAENKYCRVYGKLKAFNNKRHVGAHVIRPITDYNEVNYHLLEATAVHLFFTRGPPSTGQANGQMKTEGQNAAGGGQQDMGADGKGLPKMSSSARRVYSTLRNMPMNNEGMHVQMLASQLGMDVNEVYKGAEELLINKAIGSTNRAGELMFAREPLGIFVEDVSNNNEADDRGKRVNAWTDKAHEQLKMIPFWPFKPRR